jgi:hypothetical protein
MALTPEQEAELRDLELRDLEEREAEEMAMKPSAPKPRKEDEVSAFESFGRGVAGALSPISKYGEAAAIKARTAYEDYKRGKPSFGVPFGIAMETAEEAEAASKEQQPAAYYGGMGAGILGSGVTGAKALLPSAGKLLGIGAATGAAYEAGSVPYKETNPLSLLEATIKGGAKGVALPLGLKTLGAAQPIAKGVTAGLKEINTDPLQALGIPKAIGEGVKTTYGAIRQPQEFIEATQAARRQADPMMQYGAQQAQRGPQAIPMESLPPTAATSAAAPQKTLGEAVTSAIKGGGVSPEDEADFLLSLLRPGNNPAKEFYRQKVTQLSPSGQGLEKFQQMLEIPSSQRFQAREFDPSAIGRTLQPQAQAARQALGKKGEAFQQLQELASQEYKRTQLPSVSNAIKLAKTQYDEPGTSALTRKTVKQIDTIINQGSASRRYGVTKGPLKSADAQEAYRRLQAAREYADRAIRKNPQELSIEDVLSPLRESLDEVLKSSPSKVIADKLYSKGLGVEKYGIRPLEMKEGTDRLLSSKKIQTALGDTMKGEKVGIGIERAKEFTQEFAQQLGPKEAAKIDKFFNALADARTVAERKRIIDSVKFAEGLSGSALRKGVDYLQGIIQPTKGGAQMFTAAPEYLQSVDAFVGEQAAKQFGKNYDQLTGAQQLKLINMFQWFKKNPDAGMQEMNDAFTRILKGKSK